MKVFGIIYKIYFHEATYAIYTNDPTLAEKIQKVVKTEDFAQNIHKDIVKNSENLRERIREALISNNRHIFMLPMFCSV